MSREPSAKMGYLSYKFTCFEKQTVLSVLEKC